MGFDLRWLNSKTAGIRRRTLINVVQRTIEMKEINPICCPIYFIIDEEMVQRCKALRMEVHQLYRNTVGSLIYIHIKLLPDLLLATSVPDAYVAAWTEDICNAKKVWTYLNSTKKIRFLAKLEAPIWLAACMKSSWKITKERNLRSRKDIKIYHGYVIIYITGSPRKARNFSFNRFVVCCTFKGLSVSKFELLVPVQFY